MINLNKNLIPITIVAAGILIAGAIIYINQGPGALSSQAAVEKALNFINESIEENVTASLIDVTEENNVYKMRLKIGETEYESFITKDGKFLFPNGFSLEGQEAKEQKETSLDDFAKCLTDKGMKFYGTSGCGYCKKQKELFGDSMQYVAYVECIDAATSQWSQECKDAGISAVPTWQLPDGEMDSGFKSFKQLAELSGCSLE